MPARALLVGTLLVLLPLGSAVTAFAQELDAKWVVGKWAGNISVGASIRGDVAIEFKADGTVEGGSKYPRVVFEYRDGKWKVESDTVLVEYTGHVLGPPPEGVPTGVRTTWTLRRVGEELQGRTLTAITAAQTSVSIKRQK